MRKILSEFMEGAAKKPYRELIQHHIKRQSSSKLQQAVLGEISQLPEKLQASAMEYIDEINSQISYDQNFWAKASCKDAFEKIIQIAINFFSIQYQFSTTESVFIPENQELAFQLFQIPTVSIAYSASTQKKQRKFMGIRKGLFG